MCYACTYSIYQLHKKLCSCTKATLHKNLFLCSVALTLAGDGLAVFDGMSDVPGFAAALIYDVGIKTRHQELDLKYVQYNILRNIR